LLSEFSESSSSSRFTTFRPPCLGVTFFAGGCCFFDAGGARLFPVVVFFGRDSTGLSSSSSSESELEIVISKTLESAVLPVEAGAWDSEAAEDAEAASRESSIARGPSLSSSSLSELALLVELVAALELALSELSSPSASPSSSAFLRDCFFLLLVDATPILAVVFCLLRSASAARLESKLRKLCPPLDDPVGSPLAS
uniref:Secreted protein n=1 Tax=Rodentolepis nana TaxID=102285 RepID=A0A0R3T594_RODNA